jgi:hypothetical protein
MKNKLKSLPTLQIPPLSFTQLAQLKEAILFNEFLLLDHIGFNVTVKLPYKTITKSVEKLGVESGIKNSLLRIAYRFANDFYRTTAPIVKTHFQIAEASLFLASQAIKIDLNLMPDAETLKILNLAMKPECIS